MASTNGLKKILLITLALSSAPASALSGTPLSQPAEAMEEVKQTTLTKKPAPVFVLEAPADYKPFTPLESLKNAYALLKGTLA